jgi:hypothetical protein
MLLRNVCERVPEGQPIVAWHEVPGKALLERTVRRVRYDRAQLIPEVLLVEMCANPRIGAQTCTNHTVPYGTALLGGAPQALRAWLRSACPSGTKSIRLSKRLTIILALMG